MVKPEKNAICLGYDGDAEEAAPGGGKMKRVALTWCIALLLGAELIASKPATQKPSLGEAARTIIEAVNEKNADKYVSVFADDVVVQIYRGPVRIEGREALRQNRSQHFERFPKAYAEIQHLVEIGSTVVMHDRVWLHGKSGDAADIVEIFTFKDGLIARVEVIQPEGLLSQRAE